MTLPSIPESMSLDRQDAEQVTFSQAPPYQLGRNRAPRYRCGTCGSHNCSCVNLVEARKPGKRLSRGADARAQDLVDMSTLDHSHHEDLSNQIKFNDILSVHSIVLTVEKT